MTLLLFYYFFNVLIALGSTSVLQNFWRNLPLKKSISKKTNKHPRNLPKLPRAPQRFLVHLGSRTESPGPKKIKFSKNEKRDPQGFTQAISVPNFRQI